VPVVTRPRTRSTERPDPLPAPRFGGDGGAAPVRRRGLPRRTAGLAAALAAASWLLPLAAHALRVDWLILVVAWIGTAALLRAGGLLLDRLVLAGILLAGFLIAAGLLFSVWPWGLAPVPVGGFTLSTLTLAAVISGRRPRLPRRLIPTDALILGAGALSWHYLNAPTAGKGFIRKLPYIAAREDMFNHYTLFDAIHRVGGYAFLNPAAIKPYMSPGLWNPTAMEFYPSGMHYLFALADTFLRSTTDPGAAFGEYDRFVHYTAADLAILAAALVWAARWIAGPGLAGWRRGAFCTLVGGLAAAGQLTTLYWQAFAAHAAGLVVLALAVAVCARPPRSPREQVLLLSSLVVCATFVYNLTAVMVLGMTAIAAVVYRHRLQRHRRFAALVGGSALSIAVVPYVAQMFAGFNASSKFLMWGSAVDFARVPLAALALAALVAVTTRNGRRSPTWQAASLSVVWCCALTLAMCCYAYLKVGHTTYYCEKLIEGVWVVSLACSGAVGMLLKPGPGIAGRPRRFGGRSRNLAACGLTTGAAAIVVGIIPLAPAHATNSIYQQDVTSGAIWRAGFITSDLATPLTKVARRHMLADGVPTLILSDDWGQTNWRITMFDAALNHDRGQITDRTIDALTQSNGLATMKSPGAGSAMPAKDQQSLANLENSIKGAHVPLRVIVGNPVVASYLRAFGAADPTLGLKVVQLNNL
jgi:hypothetical protein